MSYAYTPTFAIILANVDPIKKAISNLQQVHSVQSFQAGLITDTNYGTMAATWADGDYSTFEKTSTRPKPMVLVHLILWDRQGNPWPAWTGLADSITRTYTAGQSIVYTLQASNPYKLFDVTLQGALVASQLQFDYAMGIKGTALLRIAADQCNYPGVLGQLPAALGWNYSLALNKPGTTGTIDYTADNGINTWGAIQQNFFASPAQQSWSAVLQSVLQNTEIECFFNERGQLIWRPLAYLNVTFTNSANSLNNVPKVPTIQKDTIITHAFTETDQGALTDIYVRYLQTALLSQQGYWHAPSTLANAIGPRAMVFYAPWILTQAGAMALANALGLRYSGNIHTAQVTTIGNPTIGLGTTVRVPKFPDLLPIDNPNNQGLPGDTTSPMYYYYVYGLQHNYQVGSSVTTTYDLRYGRDEKLQFPYLDYDPYDQNRNPSSLPGAVATVQDGYVAATAQTDPNRPGAFLNPFTPVLGTNKTSTLPTNYINVNPYIAYPGSVVMLKDSKGRPVGGGNGEYTVQAYGQPGYVLVTDFTVQMASLQGVSAPVFVSLVTPSPGNGPSTGTTGGGSGTNDPSGGTSTSDSAGNTVTAGGTPAAGTTTGGSGTQDNPSGPNNVQSGPDGTVPGQGTPGVMVYWPVPLGKNTGSQQGFGPVPTNSSAQSLEYRYPYPPYSTDGPNYFPHFHTGYDFSVNTNTMICSPANGVVVGQIPPSEFGYGQTSPGTSNAQANWDPTGYGLCLIIQSGPYYLLFGHLNKILVSIAPNTPIGAGQYIADSGSTGNSSAPHLHFGVYNAYGVDTRWPGQNGLFIDPYALLIAHNAQLPPSGR